MPHSTGETSKVMHNKGSANHRQLEKDFYMSFKNALKRDKRHNMQSMSQIKFGYMCSSLFNAPNELEKIGGDACFAEIQVHDEVPKDAIKRIKNLDEFNGYFTIHGEGETNGKKKIKFCSSDEIERRKYITGTIHRYSLVYDALNANKIQRLILHPDTISIKNTRNKQLELLAYSLVEIADHQLGEGMICIEPRGGDRQRKVLRVDIEDIRALQNNLNSIGSNKVGLCIDLAQLFVAYGKDGTMQFLDDLKSIQLPVKEFHVSDVLHKKK